jgi:hypothetical protein
MISSPVGYLLAGYNIPYSHRRKDLGLKSLDLNR